MSDVDPARIVHTRIWNEEPEPDNPFATRAAYCRGYDVFGELVGNARWIEMLFLLFRDELPKTSTLDAMEALAVALANPGPRDASIHAAMCGGVAGSTAAASLIAALSVGAGRNGGAREVYDAMSIWHECGTDLNAWSEHAGAESPEFVGTWPAREHLAGFEPHGVSRTLVVSQLLEKLTAIAEMPNLSWLAKNKHELEKLAGLPLAICGVAAATLADLGFTPKEGEMLYLLLRLPGAAAHALEQERLGYKKFPFYPVELEDDPKRKEVR